MLTKLVKLIHKKLEKIDFLLVTKYYMFRFTVNSGRIITFLNIGHKTIFYKIIRLYMPPANFSIVSWDSPLPPRIAMCNNRIDPRIKEERALRAEAVFKSIMVSSNKR